MAKFAILDLDGDLQQQGVRATLEISSTTARQTRKVKGNLPPAPELASCLHRHWREKYRNLGSPARLEGQKIIRKGSINQRREECKQSAQALRDRLADWLASESFRDIDSRLREEFDRNEVIPLLLRTEDPDLQKLPWQEWNFFQHYPKAEVAFSTAPFDVSSAIAPPWFKSKVKILAILGHSDGIDTERDRALLEQLPHADITFLVEQSRKDISDRLWEQAWDIIFFAGHSKTEGETGRIYLNPTESLTIDELWYALKKAVDRGLQLAIFNSCDGLGLAQKLDDLQIPQMIVMRELIPDRVAQEFLKYFLTAFALGMPLSLAVREARERLQGLEGQFPCASWLPVVYQNPAEEPLTWREMQRGRRSQERSQFWQRWKPRIGAAALLLGLVGGGWQWGKPQIARWVNNSGYDQYESGQWGSALENWERTQKINPNHPVAYYNEAHQCDRARDFDCARTNYQKAAQLGLPAAYSRLARLHILEDRDYQNAAQLAWQGLDLLTEEDGDIVKASLLTYLGWARREQGRLLDAQQHLQESIPLDRDRAVTYCLLAQVLQDQDRPAEASVQWRACLKQAQPNEPDDDLWIEIARQQLQSVAVIRDQRLTVKK